MSNLILVVTLTSIYAMLSICFIIQYLTKSFFNVAIFSYIYAVPYFISAIAGSNPSIPIFAVAIILSIAGVALLNAIVDLVIFLPISNSSAFLKTITSIAVSFLVVTIVNVISPNPQQFETPWRSETILGISNQAYSFDAILVFISILVFASFIYVFVKSSAGIKLRAWSYDRKTARAYGVSSNSILIYVSLITGVLLTIAGVFLAGSPHPGLETESVQAIALIATSVVVVARLRDLRVALITSLVIAIAQTYAWANIEKIDSRFHSIVSSLGSETNITLGSAFSTRFVPFALAFIALVLLPSRWIKEETNG